MVDVTQEHLGWAESMAQALCNPADRDCAVRLISDGLARFEQDILTRPAPDGEVVAWQRRKQFPLASDPAGKVYQWEQCSRAEATGHFERQAGYEYRSLYTHPPRNDAVVEALRDALETAERAIAGYYRYWTGGEMRGSYDGKPERQGLWEAQRKARAQLSALKQGEA